MPKTTRFISLAAAALAVVPALSLAFSSKATFGPPLLCFPLDIGDAKTIPDASAEAVVEMTKNPRAFADSVLTILQQSDSALVHLETMRRAAMTIHQFQYEKGEGGGREGMYLLHYEIMERALRAMVTNRGESLAILDAGYLLEAMRSGSKGGRSGMEYLEKAGALSPKDAAVQLALGGAAFMEDTNLFGKGGTDKCRKYYQEALRLAPEGSLIRKNVIDSAKYFLGEDALKELLKK